MLLHRNRNGFTLMEMLIVVTIIGILAAIVLPRIVLSAGQSTRAAHQQVRLLINGQLESYRFNYGVYPTAMTDTAWNAPGGTPDYTVFFPEGVPTTCNQNVAWTISNGRIDNTPHSGHE